MINVLLIASAVSALLIIVVALTWIFQERIAFQPPRGPWPGADSATRVDYFATDRQPLFAYVVGDTSAPRGLLLCFHGNADLAVWQLDWAEEVNQRTGVTVMLAEYRGYMGLAGRSTYETSQLDAMAAYRFAREELNVPANRFAFFGHSLGSAIATELAAKHQPAALLLQSPFTSARDMARRMTGYNPSSFLWRLVSRLHFDTGAQVAGLEAPVSVAHGEQDRLIPSGMGEQIFQAAQRKGEWLLVPAATHNDVADVGGESYWSWIDNALKPLTASTFTD
jgi:fermentation-respiration switch protein FrsA (DUF1100 family)